MLKNKQRLLSAAILAAVPFTAQADVLVSGGYDWTMDFTSTTSYVYADGIKSGASDPDFATNGLANHSKTSGPSGGQIYDAEKMFLEIQKNTLHVAIITGLAPTDKYASGDILFDLNGDMTDANNNLIHYNNFDEPTTSGANNSVTIAANGSSDGYEYGITVATHEASENLSSSIVFDYGNAAYAGDLFSLDEWNTGTPNTERLHPTTGRNGDIQANQTSMLYNNELDGDGDPTSLFVIEASISLDGVFGTDLLASVTNGNAINVHWNPLCNNDWIQYTGTLAYNEPGVISQVPEPAPLALMAIGLVGMIARKRRS